jgi:hypothetical protein
MPMRIWVGLHLRLRCGLVTIQQFQLRPLVSAKFKSTALKTRQQVTGLKPGSYNDHSNGHGGGLRVRKSNARVAATPRRGE